MFTTVKTEWNTSTCFTTDRLSSVLGGGYAFYFRYAVIYKLHHKSLSNLSVLLPLSRSGRQRWHEVRQQTTSLILEKSHLKQTNVEFWSVLALTYCSPLLQLFHSYKSTCFQWNVHKRGCFCRTYSDGSIHHHGTDGEHQQGNGEANTGVFCINKGKALNKHAVSFQFSCGLNPLWDGQPPGALSISLWFNGRLWGALSRPLSVAQ